MIGKPVEDTVEELAGTVAEKAGEVLIGAAAAANWPSGRPRRRTGAGPVRRLLHGFGGTVPGGSVFGGTVFGGTVSRRSPAVVSSSVVSSSVVSSAIAAA